LNLNQKFKQLLSNLKQTDLKDNLESLEQKIMQKHYTEAKSSKGSSPSGGVLEPGFTSSFYGAMDFSPNSSASSLNKEF